MKRSELVNLIHEYISAELCTQEEFNKRDCSDLLYEIEKAGMLPPICQLSTLEISDNAWEPEDE